MARIKSRYDELISKLLEHRSAGLTPTEAARLLGIGKSTAQDYYRIHDSHRRLIKPEVPPAPVRHIPSAPKPFNLPVVTITLRPDVSISVLADLMSQLVANSNVLAVALPKDIHKRVERQRLSPIGMGGKVVGV